jgi:arginyl-tRNA synthetase
MNVDPLEDLAPVLRAAAVKALGEAAEGVDPALRGSEHADAQANFAMALAKKVGKPPREVAAAIQGAIDAPDVVEKVEVAGPGFLNLTLAPAFLARAADYARAHARVAVPEAETKDRVVIDYSAPNVAKEMHVGHIRSTVIGDALARTLGFLGQRVVRQNHVGDWGTPFGMLLEHFVDVTGGVTGGGANDASVGELNAFYKEARAKFDAEPAFAERSRKRVVLLQSGDEETLALWRRLVDVSRRYFEEVYDKLDVTLRPEDICGESFYNPRLQPLADELEKSGGGVVDDGALCVFPPGFKSKEGSPLPLIVRKKDGGFGYATTDLAAIRYRLAELHATRILYVVGAPQEQHFAMVFAAAKALGWLVPPARAEHVAFGSVLGPDKKMLKSRSGDAVRLVDLLDEAIARARAVVAEKSPDLPDAEKDELAKTVGIGSVKYADLSSDRVKDYVFDAMRMVSFDGNTAGYLQYAHARIRSMMRKAAAEGAAPGPIGIAEPAERKLAVALLGFGAAIRGVESSLEPHRLAGYLYQLATTFTSFYESCPVLKSEGATRASRLALAELTAKTLERGLHLLGIRAPERM